MSTNAITVLLSFVLTTNCATKPDLKVTTSGSPAYQETARSESSQQLLADTVKLHISNGSLAPDYQFSKEWVLTEKEAVYRETVGEEPERVNRK